MSMKEYPTFPKYPTLMESHHQIVYVISGLSLGKSYPSAEMQLWCILMPGILRRKGIYNILIALITPANIIYFIKSIIHIQITMVT